MPDSSYIGENDKKLFVDGTVLSHFVRWGYEHKISFVVRNKLLSLFQGVKSFETYYGVDVTASDVNVSIKPLENGHAPHGSFPEINLPPDPKLLRDLASAFTESAAHIEEMRRKNA